MAAPGAAGLSPSLSGLALRLVRDSLLDQASAADIHARAGKENRSFFAQLIVENTIPSEQAAKAAAEEFGVPLLDIESLDMQAAPIDLVAENLIEKHAVLPLYQRGTKLFVGVTDPTNTRAIDEIKFHTGLGIEPILVDASKLTRAVDAALDVQNTALADLANEEGLENIDIGSADTGAKDSGEADAAQIDTPIVRFVNKLLLDAIKRSASDIHIETYEKLTRVRYRVDGVLHEVAAPPHNLMPRIAARLKILARLDIAERRVPQDGRMKLRLSRNRAIDFRVSTLPTLFGEKVVMRILDASATELGIEHLGFEPEQMQHYLNAVQRPYGMILVTGPTGSGKTVSLYTAMGLLNTPERNIATVEDPVEINVTGINQVHINVKANLTFATALRSFLRQDPDIIMVGEIRDLETAEIAIKASQTGHLVLSTLHTNDAPATLTRLLNMGVAPFNIASTVELIMAQRLLRRLCSNCKAPIEIPKPAMLKEGFIEEDFNEEVTIFGPVGCSACTLGYKGRVGIFQVMPVTEKMGELIMQDCTQIQIEQLAAEDGISNLRRSGVRKVIQGVTSLEEVERVTNQ